jgi:hypothetical protein
MKYLKRKYEDITFLEQLLKIYKKDLEKKRNKGIYEAKERLLVITTRRILFYPDLKYPDDLACEEIEPFQNLSKIKNLSVKYLHKFQSSVYVDIN